MAQAERLGNVRPDPRPSSDHAGHDRWLVVRAATDPAGLTSAETSEARALLAACSECAALSADLGVISHATATSVVPARPRDFRLTPEQAAAARGGVLDRLRRWLGSPGTFAVRPLAGAALAIGLLLVVVTPSLRPTVSTQGDAQTVMAPESTADATQVAKATPIDDPAGVGPEMYAGDEPSGDPALRADIMLATSPSPTDEADTTAVRMVETPAPQEGQSVTEQAGGPPAPSSDTRSSTDDVTYVLTLLGIVLAMTGLMVLVLSWFARRWQDPLLR